MKKMFVALLLAVMLLSLMQLSAFASDTGRRAGYIDSNNDGICDFASQNCGSGFADSDADGVCDNYSAAGKANYVDADGDGECDRALRCGGGYGRRNCCRW